MGKPVPMHGARLMELEAVFAHNVPRKVLVSGCSLWIPDTSGLLCKSSHQEWPHPAHPRQPGSMRAPGLTLQHPRCSLSLALLSTRCWVWKMKRLFPPQLPFRRLDPATQAE